MQSSLTYTYLYWLPVAHSWSPEAGVEHLRVQQNASLPSEEAHKFPKYVNSYNEKINPDGRQFVLETIIQTWKEILVVVKTKRFYWSMRIVNQNILA